MSVSSVTVFIFISVFLIAVFGYITLFAKSRKKHSRLSKPVQGYSNPNRNIPGISSSIRMADTRTNVFNYTAENIIPAGGYEDTDFRTSGERNNPIRVRVAGEWTAPVLNVKETTPAPKRKPLKMEVVKFHHMENDLSRNYYKVDSNPVSYKPKDN